MTLKSVMVAFTAGVVVEQQLLLAQGDFPVGGSVAGWVTAVTSIGLLGPILYWLCYVHLPSKDKQILDLVERRDSLVKSVTEEHRKTMLLVVEHCENQSKRQEEASNRYHTAQMEWLQKIQESARETVHAVRNMHASFASRTQLADAFQSAEIPAWTKKLDGTVTGWNMAATRLLGWSQGEIVGRSVYRTIIPAEGADRERELLAKIGRGETVEEHKSTRLNRSGRKVDLIMVLSPIRDQTGQVVGASAIAREAD